MRILFRFGLLKRGNTSGIMAEAVFVCLLCLGTFRTISIVTESPGTRANPRTSPLCDIVPNLRVSISDSVHLTAFCVPTPLSGKVRAETARVQSYGPNIVSS